MSDAMQTEIRAVVSLWRYPVKSMMGEEVQTAQVRDHGLLGDRVYACRGIGKALLLEAIARARTLSGLEELILVVTVGNERARALYLAVGFTSVARDPRYLKIGGQYFDIEWMHLSLSREGSDAKEAS